MVKNIGCILYYMFVCPFLFFHLNEPTSVQDIKIIWSLYERKLCLALLVEMKTLLFVVRSPVF